MKLLLPALLLATTFWVATPLAGHAEDMKLVNPDQMKWAPVPIIPGATAAVLSGDLAKPGPFVLEMHWPAGSKLGPHWHSNTERLTIISGTGIGGMGDSIDIPKGTPITAGGYAVMPAKMHHWFVAQSPVVMLVESIGPFDVNFVHPEDDPTKNTPKQ